MDATSLPYTFYLQQKTTTYSESRGRWRSNSKVPPTSTNPNKACFCLWANKGKINKWLQLVWMKDHKRHFMNYYYATDIKEAIKELRRRDIKEGNYQTLERGREDRKGLSGSDILHTYTHRHLDEMFRPQQPRLQQPLHQPPLRIPHLQQ